MSAESGVKAAGKGCTRELYLRTEFTDPQENLHGMPKLCYKLLKIAAENEFLNSHRSVSAFEKEEYKHAVSDIVVQLYVFLRSLLEHEKENSASKTLDRALVSPESLRMAWKQGKQNRLAGSKKAGVPESLDDVYRQRWHYYRNRLVGVLRDNGRRVASRDMGGWSEHSFSYGSKELPALRMDQFMARLAEFSSAFKPSLKDEDFWRGEDVLYRKDGTESRHEGPGEDKLDQFCREFWEFAAEFFGQEYLLELSMVMNALPRLYTYFARPNELFLDEAPEEDQNGEEKPQVELRSEASAFDTAEMVVQDLEARREAIVAVARTLCPRDRKLILMEVKAKLSNVEKARRLGLSSSSSILQQTANAFCKFSETGLMDILPEVKESIFYLEGMVDIAEAVWLDEKKELEAVGSLENRI